MSSEKIGGPDSSARSDEGDDVDDSRSPEAIQKEIEETRAELAETIDAIADRLSPKRAASRGAAAVKAQVAGVLGHGHGSNGRAPASVLDASAAESGHPDTQRRRDEVREIAASGGGSAYTGATQFSVKRTLRTDRVLIVVGVAAVVTAVVILRRSRR